MVSKAYYSGDHEEFICRATIFCCWPIRAKGQHVNNKMRCMLQTCFSYVTYIFPIYCSRPWLEGCTLEYGPALLPLFAVFVGCDARNYVQLPLFASCGAMVYTVYSNQSKRKVAPPTVYLTLRCGQTPYWTAFLSISSLCLFATLLLFAVSEAISKIQILHSKEYDQKDGTKLRS